MPVSENHSALVDVSSLPIPVTISIHWKRCLAYQTLWLLVELLGLLNCLN